MLPLSGFAAWGNAGKLLSRSQLPPELYVTLVTIRGLERFTFEHNCYCLVKADVLIVASYSQIDVRKHCIKCHPYWAGRLSALSDQRYKFKCCNNTPYFLVDRLLVGRHMVKEKKWFYTFLLLGIKHFFY